MSHLSLPRIIKLHLTLDFNYIHQHMYLPVFTIFSVVIWTVNGGQCCELRIDKLVAQAWPLLVAIDDLWGERRWRSAKGKRCLEPMSSPGSLSCMYGKPFVRVQSFSEWLHITCFIFESFGSCHLAYGRWI